MTIIPPGESYPVTGIQSGHGPNQGEVPLRREIDEWWFAKDEESLNQRSLFIHALARFQQRGLDKDNLSYFSIAGIHGRPLKPWPNSGKGTTRFYCAHGKYTFAVWHTPYMMLYEQRLYEEMIALIPDTFDEDDQEKMLAAAQTWRLPYWDWAMKKPDWDDTNPDSPENFKPGTGVNVPYIITQRKVPVKIKAQAGPQFVDNPMFNYGLAQGDTFGNYGVSDATRPWIESCRVTSRHPKFANELTLENWNKGVITTTEKQDYVDGVNQDWRIITTQLAGKVAARIGDPDVPGKLDKYFANSLPDAVKRLFRSTVAGDDDTPVMDFKHFTTNVYHYQQQVESYPSLEAIHNNLHGFVGGYGYMGSPGTAAFDPIFWLHHCNVDRLLAIWQELYSTQYKDWLAHGGDNEKRDPNDPDGPGIPETKLTPFAMDKINTLYIAKDTSYNFAQFGYTYPELQEWKYIKNGIIDRKAFHDDIKGRIDRLYTTTDKAALLLPENRPQMIKQMSHMSPANLELENFPPPLLASAEKAAVDNATHDIRGVAAYMKAEFGDAVEDLSWSNEDYVVNVVYERFALDGNAFSVTIFLGPVPDHNVYNFAEDESAVGRVYNFSSPAEGRGVDEDGCASCKAQKESRALFTGQVILTDSLIELLFDESRGTRPRLESLKEEGVVPYLKENLHWRITDNFGRDIPRADMPSLKVSVATATATHYSEAGRFSSYTPYRVLYEVTEGRPAGLSSEDDPTLLPPV